MSLELCKEIDADLQRRAEDGRPLPREIAMGKQMAQEFAEYEAAKEASGKWATASGIRIRAMPMLKNDTAIFLTNNKILGFVTTAQPTEEGPK